MQFNKRLHLNLIWTLIGFITDLQEDWEYLKWTRKCLHPFHSFDQTAERKGKKVHIPLFLSVNILKVMCNFQPKT